MEWVLTKAIFQIFFELYKQAGQSPNRRYRGTGLGLAVVKELTELHGRRGDRRIATKGRQHVLRAHPLCSLAG